MRAGAFGPAIRMIECESCFERNAADAPCCPNCGWDGLMFNDPEDSEAEREEA